MGRPVPARQGLGSPPMGRGGGAGVRSQPVRLVASTNGFELAEVDLELRGEGTIMNTAQKGRTDLKLASLRRDKELVALAREAAFAIVDDDPGLGRVRLGGYLGAKRVAEMFECDRPIVDPQPAGFVD